ncbi:hypothetical protein GCM10011359_31050 [Nesterenkonia alkaliphila]|nr:hypothetical protein GCM10011359_31050 [Nesterenkonia alkaliphila]
MLKSACALDFGQCACGTDIQAQLNTRVCGVDALAAWTRGVREPLEKFAGGHCETLGRSGPSGNVQIFHTSKSAKPSHTSSAGVLDHGGVRSAGGHPLARGAGGAQLLSW